MPSSPNDRSQRILGVVLAGGRSTRMGQCKTTLPHPDGGTYLERAVRTMRGVCSEVAVSLAEDAPPPPASFPATVHAIVDSQPDCGPAEGVSRSLEFAGTLHCTGVLFTPVDVPAINAEHLNRLLRRFETDCEKIVCALNEDPSSNKPLQPLVAIYPVSLTDELCSLARSSHRSLYRFIQSSEHVTVGLPADALHNVNSPHDLLT
ncbi:molybdopterin-guanine dinucleotide biosynthesis protein A [Rhodopirellula rubra]|uniref:Molybdopterin-guanine dinucleotide biosynthesis protein A n=1 Tax=Aporhodopirellula rubra TaxID=980271 RepID=A0A7W5E4B6_9BACT|nr:molybdenum cofactor guanylyltransferase [Aporhodopirellula rubra]MBB3209895.1 molybdopterin-guanine dinucleotide biosynthesis protein A [Aporhodopirellula rubra]